MESIEPKNNKSEPKNICGIQVKRNMNAEWFPWKNNHLPFEDKVGYFVTLVNGKLVYATNSFDVLGITISPDENSGVDHEKDGLVGLIGTMYVYDDGNCKRGRKCACENGIAINGNKWYVIERVSNNIIRVMFR